MRAAAGGTLIQRAIPSSGEMLRTASRRDPGAVADLVRPCGVHEVTSREVLKVFLDNGGKVVDVLHGGPVGENAARVAAAELGVQDRFFWTTPLSVNVPVLPGYAGPPPRPNPAAVRAALEEKFAAFKVSKIDLVMVGAGGDTSTIIAVLNQMKKEGRVRYIGVQPRHPAVSPTDVRQLESLMRKRDRLVAPTTPAAAPRRSPAACAGAEDRRDGVFPFDEAHLRACVRYALPKWPPSSTRRWAQFFISMLSHPSVRWFARDDEAEHMLDNIGGGIGRLPDDAMRKRMAALVDTFRHAGPGTTDGEHAQQQRIRRLRRLPRGPGPLRG